MALGGGNWTTQNKVLPGTYINFVSSASVSSAVSDRGVAVSYTHLDVYKRQFLRRALCNGF